MCSTECIDVWIFSDPESCFGIAQVNAIQPAIDAERLAKFGRATGQITKFADRSLMAHERFPEQRFDRSHQHGLGDAGGAADGIDAKMVAINEVNVGVAGWSEHDAIPRRRTRCGMASRISGQVSFSLDDWPSRGTHGCVANEEMPQQERGNNFGRRFIKRLGQRRKLQCSDLLLQDGRIEHIGESFLQADIERTDEMRAGNDLDDWAFNAEHR